MHPTLLRSAAAILGTLLLGVARQSAPSTTLMTDTANNFLASLTPEQKAKATISFQDEERFNWHYVPQPRKGLPLREMTSGQKHLAHALLGAGLSRRGYSKAATIMSLEEVLREIENDSGERRNPEGYYFSVFGQPGQQTTWGFRIEGHHLSLNFTLVGGKAAGSPSFFGANPAEVRQGPRHGLRALAREEDLARDLLGAFSNDQRSSAIVSATAYRDILTEASRLAALAGQPSGLVASRMNARQRERLDTLLLEYAENLAPELAATRIAQIRKAGSHIFFAWAGGVERGQPHYYRIQSPDFLIEYDNTQNNANHIHSVWRDFAGDFGLDLLQAHYNSSSH